METIVSMVFRALQSEYEAVEIYKEVANSSRELEREDIAQVFDEIARDEMQHIGNLTTLLQRALPDEYHTFVGKFSAGIEEFDEKFKIKNSSSTKAPLKELENIILLLKENSLPYELDENDKSITINKSEILAKGLVPMNIYEKIRSVRNSNVDVEYGKDKIKICSSGQDSVIKYLKEI